MVFGRNFQTKSAGNAEWIVVRFTWDGEALLVKMCLAPNEQPLTPAHRSATRVPWKSEVDSLERTCHQQFWQPPIRQRPRPTRAPANI